MSVSFHGESSTGEPIMLDLDHPAHLNLSCSNARAFLNFLGIEPGDDLVGKIALPEARRAIIRARATFDRRVSGFVREASDTRKPGRARVVEGGIDADYFELRLEAFERFVVTVGELGAKAVAWG